LKEFGDKLSADKKKPIEDALEELKKAYETKDIAVIDPALEKINEAWKSASEEMYKAQQSQQQQDPSNSEQSSKNPEGKESDVEDVDFEEVKE
jgi:molecular chaperone DnaK